jgi:hypothetical protein
MDISDDRLAAGVLDMEITAREIVPALLQRVPPSPVSVLVPELLAYIMELATLRRAKIQTSSWMYVALQDWLPDVHDLRQAVILSHVCGFWRRVALDSASLWTSPRLELHGSEVGFDSLWLARAKDALLTVLSDSPLRQNNAHRLGSAFISLDDPDFRSRLGSRLQHLWSSDPIIPLTELEVPFLQRLHAFSRVENEPLDLPKSAPKLRTLSLDDVDLRGAQISAVMECPFLCQLTRLAIGFDPYLSQNREDIVNVLNLIERVPFLTDLAISNVYRSGFWRTWSSERAALRERVDLPRLERLTLVGDQAVMWAVLDHIRLPEHLELWLEPAVVGSQYPDDLERVLQEEFLTRHLSQPSRMPSKLVVTYTEFQHGDTDRKDFVNLQLFHRDGQLLLSLPIRGVYSHDGLLGWLHVTAAAVPWDILKETHLLFGDTIPPDDLLERALRARRLVTLQAGNAVIVRMVELMRATRVVHMDSSDETEALLPGLRTLVAVGMRYEDFEALLRGWKAVNPYRTFKTLILEGCQVDFTAVDNLLKKFDLGSIQVRMVSVSHNCPTIV